MTKQIEKLLGKFKEKYRHLEINPAVIELTECFRNGLGRLRGPERYGNLEDNVVMGYMIKGAPFADKYEKDGSGKPIRRGDNYLIRPFDDDLRVISCLCLRDIRNTSYHEINDEGEGEAQGFKRSQVANLTQKLKEADPQFTPSRDTAFIFAGRRNSVYQRIQLNAHWLQKMISSGGKMLNYMDKREAGLMGIIFSEAILDGNEQAILEGSYMHGREIYTPESTKFLTRKVEAYQRFKCK